MSTVTQVHSERLCESGNAVARRSPKPKDASVANSLPSQSRSSSEWRPPDLVGRYHIEHSIGRGGMGEVYRAHDLVLRRRVAVKFIIGINPDTTARDRFMIEARATARLQHPNVLTIYD